MTEGRRRSSTLLAEFAVIVIGVLVALGVDAGWDQRQDRVREREYLQQVSVDLDATRTELTGAIQIEGDVIGAVDRLLAALRQTSPPPADSLSRMFMGASAFAAFRPRMGTFDALIETGDIRLIRDGALRAELMDYRNDAALAVDQLVMANDATVRTFERLGQSMNLPSLSAEARGAPAPPVGWPTLSNQPSLHSDLFLLSLAAQNRQSALQMLDASATALDSMLTN